MKKILIAPNSFKECADSTEITGLISEYLKDSGRFSEDEFIHKPLSDGGDGFLNVCRELFGAKIFYEEVTNISGAGKIKVPFGIAGERVFIESALLIGLGMVDENLRNPLKLTSFPLGELFVILAEKYYNKYNIREVITGIGGTATVDMGIGMLAATGMRLFYKDNSEVSPEPGNFERVISITKPNIDLPFVLKFIIDVDNPLLGSNGAVKVYGAQKGLKEKDFPRMEAGFINLLKITGVNENNLSGAGGGITALAGNYFQTEIVTSDQFISENILDKIPGNQISYIISGEGKIDKQSFMNKAVGIISDYADKHGIPLILICGIDEIKNNTPGRVIFNISKYFNNFSSSVKYYKDGIKYAVEEIVQFIDEKERRNQL